MNVKGWGNEINVPRNTVSLRNIFMEAKRKKWTAKEEITDSLLKFREKRKWQLAFRRYVIEKKYSQTYAPFFGLSIEKYRKWIELQFINGLNWNNFGSAWQFDHILPVAYFDFENNEDLKLCWNFINIRVEALEISNIEGNHLEILAAKPYFESLFNKTGYTVCLKMIEKIEHIQSFNIFSEPGLENFIIENKDDLEKMTLLSPDELNRFNSGVDMADIFLEREIIQKFG